MESFSCHRIFILLLSFGPVTKGIDAITLHCGNNITITSPNYPSNYPNSKHARWDVVAPIGRRILVTFIDFALEERDTLTLSDFCDDNKNIVYTGGKLFPVFLSLGNRICIAFESSLTNTRRGFELSITCQEDDALVHLVNDNLPHVGIAELRSSDSGWIRVCGDEVPRKTAKVMCRELGYPGVKEISYKNISRNGGISERMNQICTKAPSCKDHTYRLKDCDFQNHNSSSMRSLEIKCREPGFLGCYNIDSQIKETLMTESTSDCVSSCRDNTTEGSGISVMSQDGQCFCTTVEQLDLANLDKNETGLPCTQEGAQDRAQSSLTWKLVYSGSVGFCEHLGTPTGGRWRYDNAWFGSVAHLTCVEGYRLKGNGTRQCVPGVSPYVPVWNQRDSTCEQLSSTSTMDTGYSNGITLMDTNEESSRMKQGQHMDLLPNWVVIIIVCGVVTMCLVVCLLIVIFVWKKRRRFNQSRSKDKASRTGNTFVDQDSEPMNKESQA